MINPYNQKIDISRILDLQRTQRIDYLNIDQDVLPGSIIEASVRVSSLGHFWCQSITGSFTTLSGGSDVGVSVLDIQILSSDGSLDLMQDFVDAALVLTPGRRLQSGTAGNPSNQLQFESPFLYAFKANSDVIVRIRSNATADTNNIKIAFKGIRVYPQS